MAPCSSLTAILPKRFGRFALVTFLLVTTAIVYVTLFKHPPPDQLMKMNSGAGGGGKDFSLRAFGHHGRSLHHRHRQHQRSDDVDNLAGEEEEEEEEEEVAEESDFSREGEEVLEEEEEAKADKKKPKKRNILDLLDDDDDDQDDEEEKKKKVDKKKEKKVQKKKENKEDEEEKSGSGGGRYKKHKAIHSSKKNAKATRAKSSGDGGGDDKDKEEKDAGGKDRHLKGKATWDKFVAENHYTVIGIVFDACEDPTEQLGTVIMLPDKEDGGVKSRTFYNFTLDRELDEGWSFHVDVKYNGQDLYDNWWDLCELEEDLEPEERTFQCPVKPGPQSLVKDRHIPSYIPKGRYETKAWVQDSNDTILVCGYSDFRL